MPRKRKIDATQEKAEAPETVQEKKRPRKKADPEVRHRLRNIAFAFIVVVLLLTIGVMIASRLLPEYEILNLPRKAIAYVMQPVQNYFSSGTGWPSWTRCHSSPLFTI